MQAELRQAQQTIMVKQEDVTRFNQEGAHESHLALQRLRRNQPLTPSYLDELEAMLLEAGGTTELIADLKEKNKGLGIFIRRALTTLFIQ
jgi:type I site-specific restriction endonuclease